MAEPLIVTSAVGGETITTTVEGRERYGVNVRYGREADSGHKRPVPRKLTERPNSDVRGSATSSPSEGSATTPPHPLHPSRLGTLNGLPVDPATQCTLSTRGRLICEEVRLNGTQEDYVAGRGLWNRAVQQQLAAAGADIRFPKPAVELKIDWIVLDTCSNPPSGVHVERIGGTCFALAGMHLISKLKENWIWATFEPQNLTTNPERCVVLGCKDRFGSRPAVSRGGADGFTELSPKLASLMTNANLAEEWRNYRLDGVQTKFVGANGKPTLLGNSIIEAENAGVPLDQARASAAMPCRRSTPTAPMASPF